MTTGFVHRLIGSTMSQTCYRTSFITPTLTQGEWWCFLSSGINANSDTYSIILKKCGYFLSPSIVTQHIVVSTLRKELEKKLEE